MDELKFEISCKECGARSVYDPNIDALAIGIIFRSGGPTIKDRMVIFCNNCGNKYEHGIYWQVLPSFTKRGKIYR